MALHVMSTALVQAEVSDTKQLLEHDAEFFIHFFHFEELEFPVPDFHLNGFRMMTAINIARLALAWPRSHAKTTLAKLSAVWHFLFSKMRFILYISDTETVATAACRDIISWLTSENCVKCFGKPKFYIERPGEGHYEFQFNGKYCILFARGAGQQVRGLNFHSTRPQLVICDDLENLKLLRSKTAFKVFKDWFYGEFRKCVDPILNKMIYIGNMVGKDCLLELLCNEPDWTSVRYGAILNDGKPLWPENWSIPKLKKDFLEYLRGGMIDQWYADMMNMPIAGIRALIRADQITYMPPVSAEDIQYGFITFDPAISKQEWANNCGFAVHGWTGEVWMVVESVIVPHLGPMDMFKLLAALAFKWGVRVIGIESNAFQAVLKPVFDIWAQWFHYDDLMFVPVYGKALKTQRLAAWCMLLSSGQYAISSDDFRITQQLLNYDPVRTENDDDGIDACAYGPQMIDTYAREFMTHMKPPSDVTGIPMIELSPV